MARTKGNSLLETRRINRVLIKRMIFRMENATRTAIAGELGLTLPTITTSVNEMLAEGILEEKPMTEKLLVNNMGRRPSVIAFKGDAAYAVGIELGPYATRAVLMNLSGKIVESAEYEQSRENYNEMLDRVISIVRDIKKKADNKNVLGVGIGLPGAIDCEKGIIRSHPRRRDWVGRNLSADLEKSLNIPVLIDNNVRLKAVGYEMDIRREKPNSFAYFYVSRGVACPLMLRDDVFSGYTSGAGEIGHMVICTDKGQTCLDDLGSEGAIFEKCQEAMLAGRLPELKNMMQRDGLLTIHQILEAQERGSEEIAKIIDQAIDYLGIALANVVNLINPGYVVVDGCLFSSEHNQNKLLNAAKSRFFGLNEEEVMIRFTDLDHYRGAKGAGYLVIRKLFLEK